MMRVATFPRAIVRKRPGKEPARVVTGGTDRKIYFWLRSHRGGGSLSFYALGVEKYDPVADVCERMFDTVVFDDCLVLADFAKQLPKLNRRSTGNYIRWCDLENG